MDKSLVKKNPQQNPMLLSPVIECILNFVNFEDIKNCRLVSREWGSTGKLPLARRSIIRFNTADGTGRRPTDFYTCFVNFENYFSTFEISCDSTNWRIKELAKFFSVQQKHVKELTLKFGYSDNKFVKNIEISSWISKSPLVQADAKFMTKLSLEQYGSGNILVVPPLHLIAHIKELTLSNCRINLQAGIQIGPNKLKLSNATFFRKGVKLSQVRINAFADLNKTKDISLQCRGYTKYVLDLDSFDLDSLDSLEGYTALENVTLEHVKIENGETSEWIINQLAMAYIPYTLNSQMKIKELSLSHAGAIIDLFTLPTTIQKLALYVESDTVTLRCSQPIKWENLEYLHIFGTGDRSTTGTDCSFLSHFVNCPQLTHLKLNRCNQVEMKYLWMPQTVKILTLEYSIINWDRFASPYKLEKLIFYGRCTTAKEFCKGRIKFDDLVVHYWDLAVDKELVDFLEYQKLCSLCKRIYIGKLRWDPELLKNSAFKNLVDVKSLFYVFENGEKGRALSKTEFQELIPKHLDVHL